MNASRPRTVHETPIGIDVPADRYWGAQTQRSVVHFAIGDDHMPKRELSTIGGLGMSSQREAIIGDAG